MILLGIRNVGSDTSIRGHGAMPHRFRRLIDRRHGRRLEWFLAGTIKDEAPALAAEQSHNERHTRANVFLINIEGVIVDIEHGIVQLIDGLPGTLFLGRRRSGFDHDFLQKVGHRWIGGMG